MKVVVKNKEQAAKICGQLLADDYIKPKLLTFIDYKPPKTTQQIRYAHSIIGYIAKHNKRHPDKIKQECKAVFGVVSVETSSITGDRIAHFKSLGDYSKQEIDTFIIQLEAYCAENNIHYIPSTK
jgi:hypothetical protein